MCKNYINWYKNHCLRDDICTNESEMEKNVIMCKDHSIHDGKIKNAQEALSISLT